MKVACYASGKREKSLWMNLESEGSIWSASCFGLSNESLDILIIESMHK